MKRIDIPGTAVRLLRCSGPRRQVMACVLCLFSLAAACQKPVTIPEKIEWTWEVRPDKPVPGLPNVLLLGDSISRNYFPEVESELRGSANVYLMASSTSVGDPRLERQIAEFAAAEQVRFRVVHFNNGMHGWAYTEEQYKAQFPNFLRAVRALTEKGGILIWASTTPVRSDATGGATNPRIEERNRIALSFVRGAGITLDDQWLLMKAHENLHQDAVHFSPAGAKIQGDQASATIRKVLENSIQTR